MVKLAGFQSKSELIGKTDFDLWPEQAKSLIENDQKVISSGQPQKLEESVLLPNGIKRFFTVMKIPLKDADNNIIGINGTIDTRSYG